MNPKCAIGFLLASLCLTLPEGANPQSTERSKPPLAPPTGEPGCHPSAKLSTADFERILRTVQRAWQEGNARSASECFTEDAIFSAPPSRGFVGRKSLFQYFGGDPKFDHPKKIEWHHVIFDPANQVGAVEYTIQYRIQTHGVIMVKFSRGLIRNWRQYAIVSDLTWEKFTGMNNF